MWSHVGNSKCKERSAPMKGKSTVSESGRAVPSDELSAIGQNTQVIEWKPHGGTSSTVVSNMNAQTGTTKL